MAVHTESTPTAGIPPSNEVAGCDERIAEFRSVERLDPTTVAIYPDRVVVTHGEADAAARVVPLPSMVRQFMPADMEFTPEVEVVVMSLVRVDRKGLIRPRLSRANHLKILRALWEQDSLRLLRQVRVPSLVVATRRDNAEESERTFIAAKEAAEAQIRQIDGVVRFEWIEGIHDVPLQHPDAIADLIRRFGRGLT